MEKHVLLSHIIKIKCNHVVSMKSVKNKMFRLTANYALIFKNNTVIEYSGPMLPRIRNGKYFKINNFMSIPIKFRDKIAQGINPEWNIERI